jgi:hypothetical protein
MLSSIQMGMVGGERMSDNIFVIKTIIGKYLSFQKLYKCLVCLTLLVERHCIKCNQLNKFS